MPDMIPLYSVLHLQKRDVYRLVYRPKIEGVAAKQPVRYLRIKTHDAVGCAQKKYVDVVLVVIFVQRDPTVGIRVVH